MKSNSSIGGFSAYIWKFVIQGICICISPSFENAKREVREECRRLEILLGFWQGLNTIADSSIKEASNRLLIYQLWTWWICVCFNLSTVWRHSRAPRSDRLHGHVDYVIVYPRSCLQLRRSSAKKQHEFPVSW